MTVSISGTSGITFPDGSLQTAAASPLVLRNRIINGDMRIDQRNAGASVTSGYPVDRFQIYSTQSSKWTAQQSTTAPTGFKNSVLITSTSAFTPAASDYFSYVQRIEGYNVADFMLGTASASSFTVSFWVRSSLTGTFGGALHNNAFNRVYAFSYTINAANTWEQKTVTIAGDTTGTWTTDNSVGLEIGFAFSVGSSGLATAGSWSGTSSIFSATGQTNLLGTNGATLYITGVQLEIGSTATPFERRLYNQELANCQRYFAKLGANPNGSASYQAYASGSLNTTSQANIALTFPQFMRASPTIAYSGTIGLSSAGAYSSLTTINSVYTGVSSSLMQVTSGVVGTTGGGVVLLSNADATAFLSLTAEL